MMVGYVQASQVVFSPTGGDQGVPARGQRRTGLRGPTCGQLDEGGVQRPGVLLAEGAGLEQLLDEGTLLLLQLRDPLALVRHLLADGGRSGPAGPPTPPHAPHTSPG